MNSKLVGYMATLMGCLTFSLEIFILAQIYLTNLNLRVTRGYSWDLWGCIVKTPLIWGFLITIMVIGYGISLIMSSQNKQS